MKHIDTAKTRMNIILLRASTGKSYHKKQSYDTILICQRKDTNGNIKNTLKGLLKRKQSAGQKRESHVSRKAGGAFSIFKKSYVLLKNRACPIRNGVSNGVDFLPSRMLP